MKDTERSCQCGQMHKWGIVRYSQDNTPLYGARPAENGCKDFRPSEEGSENLPAMPQDQTEALWAQTSFLNPQVPTATRVAVARIMAIGKGKAGGLLSRVFGGNKGGSIMEKQWPEFMGLAISQLTDIRGAMVRDDSKFAHLVAHTDEIVESMRGVVQLAERLETLGHIQSRILDKLDEIEQRIKPVEERPPETSSDILPLVEDAREASRASVAEAAKVFAEVSKSLWNEPIVVDAVES